MTTMILKSSEPEYAVESTAEMSAVMGFGGFGSGKGKKTAQTFDVEVYLIFYADKLSNENVYKIVYCKCK